jgi:hypothetical protein
MASGVSVQSCLFFQQKSNHAGLCAAWFIRTCRMRIGPYTLPNNLFVAPMAGVTDRPFRKLCKQLGAGYAVSEMVTSRPDLWDSLKTSRRANHEGEAAPIAVQIAGTDAAMMADAARYNIDRGAQIIDINMGCPAKKVCNKWAGSALMQDEALALQIVEAVVLACPAARRARDTEDAHRLGRPRQKRPRHCLGCPGRRGADAYRAWTHARAGLQGHG